MKIKTKFIIASIIFPLSFLVYSSASASKTFFEAEKTNIIVGDIFEASFFIDTEGKDINAIEGKIVFPEKLLGIKEVSDGNSIVNFWVERPNEKNGEISFSGIIPGGYLSKKGFIFSVIFRSLGEGVSPVEIKSIRVLANDGKGTPVETSVNNIQFNISKKIETILISTSSNYQIEPSKAKDLILPEIFEPKVVGDSSMFNGKYFLVFATQDKGSGIDHYEVLEQKVLNIFNSQFVMWEKGWIKTDSPYVLNDQSIHSYIHVKAVDKNGNERIVVISPKNSVKLFEIWWTWVIIVVILTILYFSVHYKLRRK